MKIITLTQGKVALVDDDDYDRVIKLKWHASKQPRGPWYAVHSVRIKRSGKHSCRSILMHKFISGVADQQIDHRDGNGLNNQKNNLRPSTQAQNCHNRKLPKTNTSGFKGVSWHTQVSCFTSQITVHGKAHHLGCFSDPILAAKAYDCAAYRLCGEFARTNKAMGLLT